MNVQAFRKKIRDLVFQDKTEEALTLLSKAKLSIEMEKVVASLSAEYKRAKKDKMLNNISQGKNDRRLNKINKTLMDLSDEVEPNPSFIAASVDLLKKPLIKAKKDTAPLPTKINTFVDGLEQKDIKQKDNKKSIMTWGAAALVLLLIISVFIYRTFAGSNPSPVLQNNTAVADDAYLKTGPQIWQKFQAVYQEDFSNVNRSDFRKDIWKTKQARDYSAGVVNGHYVFDLKKDDNNFARCKYLGGISYDTESGLVPYSVSVVIDDSAVCNTSNNCIGRGLTVNHDKDAKPQSAYTFTINDGGDLNFMKLNNVFSPQQGKSLFKTKKKVKKGEVHRLGVISFKGNFYLYFNQKLLTIIQNEDLRGTYNGVYASGQGVHSFDQVTIFKYKK